jgi:hypothetical protein
VARRGKDSNLVWRRRCRRGLERRRRGRRGGRWLTSCRDPRRKRRRPGERSLSASRPPGGGAGGVAWVRAEGGAGRGIDRSREREKKTNGWFGPNRFGSTVTLCPNDAAYFCVQQHTRSVGRDSGVTYLPTQDVDPALIGHQVCVTERILTPKRSRRPTATNQSPTT